MTHLAIFFRNFLTTGFCHAGLGVNALQTKHVLHHAGYNVEIHGLPKPEDILATLQAMPRAPSHVVIEAVWVDAPLLRKMLEAFPHTKFAVRTHSQVGFLQVEPPAVKIIREMLVLQGSYPNLMVAANNTRLCHFLERVYLVPCLFLPNLYDVERAHTHHHREPDVLRIASFGALRLLKNHMTSAAAALLIGREIGVPRLEFWLSVNREENAGAKGILAAIRNLYTGVSWAKLVEHPWEDWHQFRHTMERMDLYLQPSFTETFNITVADAIVAGVPAVVSDAIDWAPDGWKAEADSVEDIARIGIAHLHNPTAAQEGLGSLRRHVENGVRTWARFLS